MESKKNNKKLVKNSLKMNKNNPKMNKNKAILSKNELNLKGEKEINNLFKDYKKILINNNVDLDKSKINFLKTFCKIEWLIYDMNKKIRQLDNYYIDVENIRGNKRQEKNPILPEYNAMLKNYKSHYIIIEKWIKESNEKIEVSPILQTNNNLLDEILQLEEK